MKKGLDDELKNFCEFAITKAGKIAISLQKNLKISYKSKNQPVTNADMEIDQFLFSFFQQKTPNFGWLSEESVDNKSRQESDFFWCLDPIDGTRSYISGKPEYTISLALIKESQPIFGIIYNPVTNEYFTAEKKKGAFCNRKRIRVKKNKNVNFCSFAVSSSEANNLTSYQFIKKNQIRKMGSIAYKIALVAKGSIDVALSFTKKNDWDLAAADLIVSEAGGEILGTDGKKIIYNSKNLNISSVMASNIHIISELKNKF